MLLNKKKNTKEKLNIENINQSVNLLTTILKIFMVLLIIVGVFVVIKILKELHVAEIILTILKIMLPFFIGFFIAWLFDPFVTYLQKKGIRRTIGTLLTDARFLSVLGIIIGSIIPTLGSQINDFVKMIPQVFDNLKSWVNELFDRFNSIDNINMDTVKGNLLKQVENFGTDLTASLPSLTFNILKAFFAGVGNFIVGLVIGFFLLISFDNVTDSIITLFPKKMQESTRDVFNEINIAFRRFINGAFLYSKLE